MIAPIQLRKHRATSTPIKDLNRCTKSTSTKGTNTEQIENLKKYFIHKRHWK